MCIYYSSLGKQFTAYAKLPNWLYECLLDEVKLTIKYFVGFADANPAKYTINVSVLLLLLLLHASPRKTSIFQICVIDRVAHLIDDQYIEQE